MVGTKGVPDVKKTFSNNTDQELCPQNFIKISFQLIVKSELLKKRIMKKKKRGNMFSGI